MFPESTLIDLAMPSVVFRFAMIFVASLSIVFAVPRMPEAVPPS